MDFEQALVFELQKIAGLGGKVFPQQAEDETKPPFIVYVSSEGEPIMTLGGATDMTELTCEIHVVAESYQQLKSLTKSVLDHIRGFFRRSIGQTGLGQTGLLIKSISHMEPVEHMDNNTNYHRSSFDIRVRF